MNPQRTSSKSISWGLPVAVVVLVLVVGVAMAASQGLFEQFLPNVQGGGGNGTPTPTPSPTTTPTSPTTTPTTIPPAEIWHPEPGTSWQWQLQGTIDTSFDVDMYDIDLFDTSPSLIAQLHNDGRIVICYFSAGSYEEWRPDAAEFPEVVLGEPLEGWPGERWLDVRNINALAPIMTARLDMAAEKGCDGVEPDNVDGYANESGFPLTGDDQIAYNRWLAEQAHNRSLSIGLKNDLAQIPDLVEHFDWALNEQCFAYEECELLLPFVDANKAVFGVEYDGTPEGFCPQANTYNFDWLFKHLELDEYRVACR